MIDENLIRKMGVCVSHYYGLLCEDAKFDDYLVSILQSHKVNLSYSLSDEHITVRGSKKITINYNILNAVFGQCLVCLDPILKELPEEDRILRKTDILFFCVWTLIDQDFIMYFNDYIKTEQL